MMPRCGRCGAEVYLFSVQDQGAAGCNECGLIVYEDGHTRDEPELVGTALEHSIKDPFTGDMHVTVLLDGGASSSPGPTSARDVETALLAEVMRKVLNPSHAYSDVDLRDDGRSTLLVDGTVPLTDGEAAAVQRAGGA